VRRGRSGRVREERRRTGEREKGVKRIGGHAYLLRENGILSVSELGVLIVTPSINATVLKEQNRKESPTTKLNNLFATLETDHRWDGHLHYRPISYFPF
jgi:hypothetical protein